MTDLLVALVGAAGLVAVALISRPHAAIKRIDERTAKELEHNGGGSIKDDVYGIAVATSYLERRFDALATIAAVHHPEHAHLYLALRSNHNDQTS